MFHLSHFDHLAYIYRLVVVLVLMLNLCAVDHLAYTYRQVLVLNFCASFSTVCHCKMTEPENEGGNCSYILQTCASNVVFHFQFSLWGQQQSFWEEGVEGSEGSLGWECGSWLKGKLSVSGWGKGCQADSVNKGGRVECVCSQVEDGSVQSVHASHPRGVLSCGWELVLHTGGWQTVL